jgi:hypothetical protein
MRVPFRRFVGRTGGVVAPPVRAGCDFIEACLFEKGLIAVMCPPYASALASAKKE